VELEPDGLAPVRSLFAPKAGRVHAMAAEPAPMLLAPLRLTQLMKTWLLKRFGLG
jgi:hypothetical protein